MELTRHRRQPCAAGFPWPPAPAKPLSPLLPPMLGFSQNSQETWQLLFLQRNRLFLRLSTQRTKRACACGCVCACTQATHMRARTQAHGKNYLGDEKPDCSASPSTRLRQPSLITLLWDCIMFMNIHLYTHRLSIYYIGSLQVHSCTHKAGTWKDLWRNECKKCLEMCWQILACLSISVHTVCFFINLVVTLL